MPSLQVGYGTLRRVRGWLERREAWAGLACAALPLALCLPLLFTALPTGNAAADSCAVPRLARGALGVVYDDGLYYLEIARNVAAGRGSSFDGLHPTNGYHPLWLLTLVPLVRWASGRELSLVLAFLAQAGMAAAACALVYRSARALGPRPLAAVLGTIAFAQHQTVYWTWVSGLEYAEQLLLLSALGVCLIERKAPPARIGWIGALATLARLDNGLLVALVAIQSWRVRRQWRDGIACLRPSLLLVGGYLAASFWFFSHLWPVSAELKAEWSAELLARDPVANHYGALAAKLWNLTWPFTHMPRGYLLLPCIGLAWAIGLLVRPAPQARLRAVASFALLQVALYAAIYHDGYSFEPWYFAVQPWLGALALAVAAEALLGATARTRAPSAAAWGVAALAAGLLVVAALNVGKERARQLQRVEGDPLYATALWVRDHAPAGAVIGSWNAGLVATLSGHTVVNLDGLVNSWAFHDEGRKDLCRYWQETHVSLLADVFPPDSLPGGQAAAACASGLRRLWVGPIRPGSGYQAAVFAVPPAVAERPATMPASSQKAP